VLITNIKIYGEILETPSKEAKFRGENAPTAPILPPWRHTCILVKKISNWLLLKDC
jgi:hypothetical protein